MGLITDVWNESVEYQGKHYRTKAAFDAVLTVQKLYKDEELSSYDKATVALKLLLRSPFRIGILSPVQRIELLEEIFDKQVDDKESKNDASGRTRTVDFELDGEYIYAAFLQDYGIDLIEYQGRLHWKKFLALFQGLSDDTKIKQIMHIRAMDIPAPTKHNQEQIRKIMELKSYYALPVKGGGGQAGLDRLFDTLERLAEK